MEYLNKELIYNSSELMLCRPAGRKFNL